MEDFDDNVFATHSHVEGDAHVSTKNLEGIEAYRPGTEAVWSTIAQLRETAELVIHEAWKQSLLPRVGEEGVGTVDIGPSLDNSTIHWKPPEEGIVLFELFGSIGNGLAVVLQAGIKVKCYVYVDVDDVARQVAKQHARRLRTQFPDLLAYTAIMSSFSTLVGDIALLSKNDIHWLGHVDLVIAGWSCQGMSMAGQQNGLQDDCS
jgi:hypothetical protein